MRIIKIDLAPLEIELLISALNASKEDLSWIDYEEEIAEMIEPLINTFKKSLEDAGL